MSHQLIKAVLFPKENYIPGSGGPMQTPLAERLELAHTIKRMRRSNLTEKIWGRPHRALKLGPSGKLTKSETALPD